MLNSTPICNEHTDHVHAPGAIAHCPLYHEFCAVTIHFIGAKNVRPGQFMDAAEVLEHHVGSEVYERLHGFELPELEYSAPLTDAKSYAEELVRRFGILG